MTDKANATKMIKFREELGEFLEIAIRGLKTFYSEDNEKLVLGLLWNKKSAKIEIDKSTNKAISYYSGKAMSKNSLTDSQLFELEDNLINWFKYDTVEM